MHQFDRLAERLLREGVAYRHVRRYVGELRDHYDDAVRAEMANGNCSDDAHASAASRLGAMDDLANEMISRPELRSMSARFPRLWGGAAPTILWLATVVVSVLAIIGLMQASKAAGLVVGGAPVLAALQTPANAFLFLLIRAMPVAVGGAMLASSLRQHAATKWPLIGAGLLAVLGSLADASIYFSQMPDTPSAFNFGAGFTGETAGETAVRAAFMFALMLAPLLLKKRLMRLPV